MGWKQEARVHLIGTPKATFEFTGLPSVNTHYGQHFRPRGIATSEWRYEAREKAYKYWDWCGPLIEKRALVVVRVFPPFEEISDIHNVYIKGILDGFTDAGLWVDDEWAWVPLVWYQFGGIGEQKPRQHKIRRTVIDVYELGTLFVNHERQRLPKGRIRNEEPTSTGKDSPKTNTKQHEGKKSDRPNKRKRKGNKRR